MSNEIAIMQNYELFSLESPSRQTSSLSKSIFWGGQGLEHAARHLHATCTPLLAPLGPHGALGHSNLTQNNVFASKLSKIQRKT